MNQSLFQDPRQIPYSLMKTECYELIAKDEEKGFAEQFLFFIFLF